MSFVLLLFCIQLDTLGWIHMLSHFVLLCAHRLSDCYQFSLYLCWNVNFALSHAFILDKHLISFLICSGGFIILTRSTNFGSFNVILMVDGCWDNYLCITLVRVYCNWAKWWALQWIISQGSYKTLFFSRCFQVINISISISIF